MAQNQETDRQLRGYVQTAVANHKTMAAVLLSLNARSKTEHEKRTRYLITWNRAARIMLKQISQAALQHEDTDINYDAIECCRLEI